MSTIVEVALDHRLLTVIGIRLLGDDKAAPRLEMLSAAGRAIVAASQAAASGNVIAGAPRTWAVRWSHGVSYWWPHDDRDVLVMDMEAIAIRPPTPWLRPTWDAPNRLWIWSSHAYDPRPCAWPRPWVGGEVGRG